MEKLEIYAYGVRPNIWTERNKRFRDIEHFPNTKQVAVCQRWLAGYTTKAKSKCCPKSSYFLKHVCERMMGRYISNGAMVQAAIDMGYEFTHRQGSINIGVYLNLKPAARQPIQGNDTRYSARR